MNCTCNDETRFLETCERASREPLHQFHGINRYDKLEISDAYLSMRENSGLVKLVGGEHEVEVRQQEAPKDLECSVFRMRKVYRSCKEVSSKKISVLQKSGF